MQWRNNTTRFGVLAKLFHWTSAAAFIGAYIVVYYVIWFMDYDTQPESLLVLNIQGNRNIWLISPLLAACNSHFLTGEYG